MRARIGLVALALTTLVGACGGNNAESDGLDSDTEDPPTAGSGVATLTIGDTTVEFSGLTCHHDAAAAEAASDETATFSATARNGAAVLIISVREKGLEQFEVTYLPGDDSGDWHMVSTSADPTYTVEDGRITAFGVFQLILDSEATARTRVGSVEATCG